MALPSERGAGSPSAPPWGLRGLNPAELSVLDLLGAIRRLQLWSMTITLANLLAVSFSPGARLVTPFGERPNPVQGALRPEMAPGAVECPCRSSPPDTPGRSSA